MAIIEPLAIRCGLLPADLWTMTPAEMTAVITVRNKGRSEDQEFMDLLNGKACANAFSLAIPGSKPKPRDFMITQRGNRKHG
jgi:hypothetical protein